MAFQQYPQKLGIPSGNTAARPSSPIIGDTYYNGELGLLEIYNGTDWVPSSAPAGIPSLSVTDVGTSRPYGSGAIAMTFTAGTNGGAPYGYIGSAVIGATSYTTGTTSTTTATLVVGNDGTYSCSATAYNGFGTSPSSLPLGLAVTTVPQAPTIGSVTLTTDVVVNWTNGNTGGKAITAIKVNAYDGATLTSTTTAATTSSTSATITGLTVGTTYTFKVFASNANGDGLESSASTSVTVGPTIDYLVVAGGASGGSHQAAGGGAGGLRSTVTATGGGGTLESVKRLFKGVAYTVTVGNGGAAVSGSTNVFGNNGGNSSISGTGITTVTSLGGGAGGAYGGNGRGYDGGSGGGEGSAGTTQNPHVPGAGTANEGYAGGYGFHTSPHGGGGGGGAGAIGGNADQSGTTGTGGNGGVGVAVSITGSSVYYAGGGGGSGWGPNTTATPGSGGTGGGGRGGNSSGGVGANGVAGTANTGGGGGGSGTSGSTSGAGGSGVVIIRATTQAASTTGSPTYTTSGSYHIYQFNGNGSITY